MITIKKYPNRRLYDTSQSKYINLEDIKTMIKSRDEFQIVDSKTQDVITKSVLLQIISESESNQAQSLLTDKLLQQLIRYYDNQDMQPLLRQYLGSTPTIALGAPALFMVSSTGYIPFSSR